MYTPPPTAAECGTLGLTLEDVTPPPLEIWPDCWESVFTFEALSSQWNIGFSGASGLLYASLPVVLEMRGIDRSEWPDIFEDIRIMESAALQIMRIKSNG